MEKNFPYFEVIVLKVSPSNDDNDCNFVSVFKWMFLSKIYIEEFQKILLRFIWYKINNL